MLRSMASAISGLRNHQTYMDVVANNIANVNTNGFKASRANFKDAISQTVSAGSDTTDSTGGLNPTQIGLGTNLGAIDSLMTQGSLISTGKNTDLAIQGDGFFQLGKVATDGTVSPAYYTRDGAFTVDKDGYLVESTTGLYVLGHPWDMAQTPPVALDEATVGAADAVVSRINVSYVTNSTQGDAAAGTVDTATGLGWASFSIGTDGKLTGVKADGSIDEDHKLQIYLAKFPNPEGLVKSGGNLYQKGPNSGDASEAGPGDMTVGLGTLVPGSLEASNVDLAEQFSRMIMAQRGFQANSRAITASDEMLQDLVNLKR